MGLTGCERQARTMERGQERIPDVRGHAPSKFKLVQIVQYFFKALGLCLRKEKNFINLGDVSCFL